MLRALDRKAEAAAKDTRTINDGLAVLEKAAKDGVIALSEAEVASLRNVVSDYTGVGLRELAGTMKDVAARQEALEQHLGEKDGPVRTSCLWMARRNWQNEQLCDSETLSETG